MAVHDLGLKTGEKVKVVGYEQTRMKKINGQDRQVTEIYALNVKPIRIPQNPSKASATFELNFFAEGKLQKGKRRKCNGSPRCGTQLVVKQGGDA